MNYLSVIAKNIANRANIINCAIFFALFYILYLTYYISVFSGNDGLISHLADDNMITLRVAWNYFTHGVLHFNNGEAVAASTSLTWPLILSNVFYVSDESTSVIYIYILSIFTCLISSKIAASIFENLFIKSLVILAITLSPSLIAYGGSGWEHIGQMLLITTSFVLLINNNCRYVKIDTISFIFISFSFIIRPDIPFIVLIVWIFYVYHHSISNIKTVIITSFLMSLMVFIYFYIMHLWYGDLFPNTYYLKINSNDLFTKGLNYIFDPAKSGPVPGLAVVALLLSFMGKAPKVFRLVSVSISAHVLFVLWIGGDAFDLGRFFLCLLPISMALVAYLVCTIAGKVRIACITVIGATVFSWLFTPESFTLTNTGTLTARAQSQGTQAWSIDHEVGHIELMATIVETLGPEDGSLGLHRLGMAFHAPQFHVVDFLGKAEPHIARMPPKDGAVGHNKYDYTYALSKYDIAAIPFPTAEFRRIGRAGPNNIEYSFYWHLGNTPGFLEKYTYLEPDEIGISTRWWGLFVRNDLIKRFKSQTAQSLKVEY